MPEANEPPGGESGRPPGRGEADLLAERRARRAVEGGEQALIRRAEAAEATVHTLERHVHSLQQRLREAEEEHARLAAALADERGSTRQRRAGAPSARQREYEELQLRREAEQRERASASWPAEQRAERASATGFCRAARRAGGARAGLGRAAAEQAGRELGRPSRRRPVAARSSPAADSSSARSNARWPRCGWSWPRSVPPAGASRRSGLAAYTDKQAVLRETKELLGRLLPPAGPRPLHRRLAGRRPPHRRRQ